MILASKGSTTTASQQPPKKSPTNRPDSPGGYFTLSDSDGGSSNLESSSSDDLHHATSPPRSLYKIYKNNGIVRSSSEPPIEYGRKTPPRPLPPKSRVEAIDENEDGVPPRPPPPLSYTSTLPPPVPKKMGTKKGIVAQQNVINRKIVPPPPPPPLANVNQKVRPLQRVQPLQIQSPSMISMVLQPNNSGTVNTGTKYHHQKQSSGSSLSDDNSLDGNIAVIKKKEPVTFVKTFQKATASSSLKVERPKQRPISIKLDSNRKKKANNSSSSTSTDKRLSNNNDAIAGYMKPTKNAILRQTTDVTPSSTTRPKKASDVETHHSKARRSLSSSSSVSDKSCSCEEISMKKKKKSTKKDLNDNSSSTNNNNNNSNSKMKKIKQTVTELKRSASEIPKSPKLRSKLMSAASKSQEDGLNNCVKLKNPIQSLIKFYDEGRNGNNKQKEPVVLIDEENVDSDKRSSNATNSSHLSQLSQISMDKIQSWFSNPMMSIENKDLSVTEINILDQYVTDMISFSQGALSEIKSKNHISTANICVQDVVSLNEPIKDDVEIVNHNEKSTNDGDVQNKCESIIIEDKTPSEEEIQKGVFTEVSCAGNVIKTNAKENEFIVKKAIFKPVPSPRVKRKARKEQMLLEHKEKGHQALSMVMKQMNVPNVPSVPNVPEVPHKDEETKQMLLEHKEKGHQALSMVMKQLNVPNVSNVSNIPKVPIEDQEKDGLQCLDDLCTQSRQIEKELHTKLVKKDEDDTTKVGV